MKSQYVIDTLSDMRAAVSSILAHISGGRDMNEASLYNIRLVLNELITNAFLHGNAYAGKRPVTVAVDDGSPGELEIAVEDSGCGFENGLEKPAIGESVLRDHGRGLVLVKALAREMTFNERGNRVCVRMNM